MDYPVMRMEDPPLLIVSNRGPMRFETLPDGSHTAKRGGGGLVTALSALTTQRPLTWVASALSDDDAEMAAEGVYEDGNLRLSLVAHDREEYDRYYNVFANPTLWFIHHYLWGLAMEPDVDRNIRLAWDAGYLPVNERFAEAVAAEIEDSADDSPVVMVHDYQLFMVPRGVRERAPRARIQHFTHIPWPMPDYWRILPDDIRRAIHESLLNCDIVGLHTDRYVRAFLHCCNELTDGEVDFATRTVRFQGRDVQVRAYPISVDPTEFERLAASDEVREEEASVVLARPEKMILRVDRTDPSKNVVRGLRAYDLFLSQHPEWRGRVTMLALLDPSRPEIPEYAEYVGAIQRAVREVNDRWYMTGMWTPVDMRISDNFPQAVAAYKHYDVLLVNAIFDGMNLVAKEAPLVNQRDGVLILSENAGAHQELSPWALCVNPFDIQAQADAIYQALTMHSTERHERIEGLRAQVREHDISRWIDTQLEDLAALRPVKA
jgi:trehalose 6-phosphate synthase